jgi:hypothetical protein
MIFSENRCPLFRIMPYLHVHFAAPGCYAARIERA